MSDSGELLFSKEKQVSGWHCPKDNQSCSRRVPCRSCQGRRNRRKGLQKQRVARKALGIRPQYHGQAANEEAWRDEAFRWECKAGKQVESLSARFLTAEKQSDQNKAIGDSRPFAFVAMPEGMSDGIVAVRLSVWRTLWKGEE